MPQVNDGRVTRQKVRIWPAPSRRLLLVGADLAQDRHHSQTTNGSDTNRGQHHPRHGE
jgi:hypothetical protein